MAKVTGLQASRIRANSFILTFNQLNNYKNYFLYIDNQKFKEITELTSRRFFDGFNWKISYLVTGTNDGINLSVQVTAIHNGIEDQLSDPITVKTGYFLTNPPGSTVDTSQLDYAYDIEFLGLNQETIDRLDKKIKDTPIPVDIQTVTIPDLNIGDVKIEDKDIDGRKLNVVLENQTFLSTTFGLPILFKNLTASTYNMGEMRRLDDNLVLNSDYGILVRSHDTTSHSILTNILTALGGTTVKNPINVYSTAIIPNNLETTILSSTVPTGKTWKIEGFEVWGDVWGDISLKIDNIKVGGGRSTSANLTLNIDYREGIIKATSGKIITVAVKHKIGASQVFYCNLYGYEV